MENTIITTLNIEELTEVIKSSVLEAILDQNSNKLKQTSSDDLIKIEDIQDIFGVSKVTVHKWKKKGLIPYYKMNRKVYFKKSEVINSMCHKIRKMEV
jgi:hypothetical protein